MDKTCIKCHLSKNESYFYYRKWTNSLNNKCKECVKLESKSTYSKNREKVLDNKKIYHKENRTSIRITRKNNDNKRYKDDIQYKLKVILRKRLWHALKKNFKTGSAIDNLGCSIDELKAYLESLFELSMNWGNYSKEWQIDHVKPLFKFDLTNLDQLKEACNYKNLQPILIEKHKIKSTLERNHSYV